MSIQLLLAAAYLPKDQVNQTQKLVLMKIADSADDQTRLARPGLERMLAWAGVGEKRVITVVTELVGLGLVERIEVGRAGRRAEYRVFPHGVPPVPSGGDLTERRSAARHAPKNPRLARERSGPGPRPSTPARTRDDLSARDRARLARRTGFPPRNPGDGPGVAPQAPSGVRQGNPDDEDDGARGEPSGLPEGDQPGSPGATPSVPGHSSSSSFPPTPTAAAAGEPAAEGTQPPTPRGCPRHPLPAACCRGCGTSPRAVRDRERHRSAEGQRIAEQAWLREFLDAQRRRVAATDPQALQAARQHARELARAHRPTAAPVAVRAATPPTVRHALTSSA